jgi:hypothetical protein
LIYNSNHNNDSRNHPYQYLDHLNIPHAYD